MHNIDDLQFKKDILPLFDFTNNELTRQTLTQWLTDFPESESEILLRQDILKGFLRNDQLFLPFTYSAVEFNEVHSFLTDINNRDPNAIPASSRLHLFLAKKERQQERGRLSQLLLFFQKLFRFYFSGLELNHFPDSFQIRLNRIFHFLSDLQLNEYEQRIRNQGLSIRDMTRLNGILVNKCRKNETQLFWEDLFLFEAYLSISKGIRKNQFNFPRFDEENISFVDCYHPLIKKPVKNSLLMKERVILLSGPNMSGKSTLLKSIGLCVVLGHLGLPVPAASCSLLYFDSITVMLHLKDDLASGYSHFMTEIKALKNVLKSLHASKRCFAIFDELFRGTNEEDALAILRTTVRGLAKSTNGYFLMSTHLQPLKEEVEPLRGKVASYYIECNIQQGLPVFSFKLRPGWSELKIGQLLFQQEGLDKLLS